jgi:hypothetical protein
MTSVSLVIAVTSFLSGAAAAVFTMLVIGIRKGDRPWHLHPARSTPLDAVTRGMLRTGSWPHTPVAFGGQEDTSA